MAFAQDEPFGFEAGLLGHAITSSVIANANRKKGSKAYEPKDFLPKPGGRDASPNEIWQNFKAWAVAAGGKKGKRSKK